MKNQSNLLGRSDLSDGKSTSIGVNGSDQIKLINNGILKKTNCGL